jgi:multicomponent Na+:H+ antiporter subunit A
VLALAALAGALVPGLLSHVAGDAGTAARNTPVELHVAYEIATPLLLAVIAWIGGAVLYLLHGRWQHAVAVTLSVSERIGPDAQFRRLLATMNALSDRLHDLEVRDLRDRVAAILFPAGVLIAFAAVLVGFDFDWTVGPLSWSTLPLLIALVVLATTALATPTQRTHLGLVVALTALGFTLASVYALIGAPDLALVAALIETTTTILLLAAFGVLPPKSLRNEEIRTGAKNVQKRRHRFAGVAAGAIAFVVAWTALSDRERGSVAEVQYAWSERVHAKDSVSAILADFRGLDTAGETTVIAIALLGLITLLRWEKHA